MLNSTQVAKALGVNPSTLSRWRAQGVGPRVYWLGKSCPRYREDDVLEWLERNAA
jgi:predicted DNA-binding transcriptional regulator AlpA